MNLTRTPQSTSEEELFGGDADDDGEDGDDDEDDEGNDSDGHPDEDAKCGGVKFLVGRLSVLALCRAQRFVTAISGHVFAPMQQRVFRQSSASRTSFALLCCT